MKSDLLRFEGVAKAIRLGWRRASTAALRLVEFRLQPGQITGLLGPNGAGKTTTMFIAVGLVRQDRGVVKLFGDDPGRAEARRRITFLPERFEAYSFLAPRELLEMQGSLYGLPAERVRRRSDQLLAEFGLIDLRQPVRTLSKGMNQRLGLACALLPEVELLVLDEPSSGLDPEGRQLLSDVLYRERQRGTAVLLSSHILADVERMCDEAVIIRAGESIRTVLIAELDPGLSEWEIETDDRVVGLLLPALLSECRVSRAGESLLIHCSGHVKERILDCLTASAMRPTAVRQTRSALEHVYMSSVGGS